MNSEELKKIREELENFKSSRLLNENIFDKFRMKDKRPLLDIILRRNNSGNNTVKTNNNGEKNNEITNNGEKNNEITNNGEKNNKITNNGEKNNEITNNGENNEKVDKQINFKDMQKYSSSSNIPTYKDFESQYPKVTQKQLDNKIGEINKAGGINPFLKNLKNNKVDNNKVDNKDITPKISPASFKTNQRQTRELVKSGELKDTDLNKYSRSNTYTADDGKTQVNRSTVNTIAKFNMGPNIKKGDRLGVITNSMRKKYDLKAANFKEDAYDVLLNYVLSEGHADTVEEAHYVMMQMDEDTIQTIIREQKPFSVNQSTYDSLRNPEFTGDPTSHFQNFKFKDKKNQEKYSDATKKLKIKVDPRINQMDDPKITTDK